MDACKHILDIIYILTRRTTAYSHCFPLLTNEQQNWRSLSALLILTAAGGLGGYLLSSSLEGVNKHDSLT